MSVAKLRRFDTGAPEIARRSFARELMAALDRLGVQPGGEFILAAAEAKPEGPHDANRLGRFAAGSSTSRKAALDNYPRSGTQRDVILRALVAAGPRGATSDELHAALGMPNQSIKPRLGELRDGGWAYQTGDTRPSLTGSAVDVYAATEKGVEAVRSRPIA